MFISLYILLKWNLAKWKKVSFTRANFSKLICFNDTKVNDENEKKKMNGTSKATTTVNGEKLNQLN